MGTNIKFDSYELVDNPSDIDPPFQKTKDCAFVKTNSSADSFDWGSSYAGNKHTLTWSYMTTAEYTILKGKCEDGTPVVLDPQDDEGYKFTVKILDFYGPYFHTLKDETGNYRQKVKMIIGVLSAEAVP